MKLKINPVFRDLLPTKSDEDKAALEERLLAEGCLDPIIYWAETGFILDGHHRFEIVQKHDLNYMTKRLSFKEEDEAIEWIVQHQLTRRNLTDLQRTYYIGQLYLARLSLAKIKTDDGQTNERGHGVTPVLPKDSQEKTGNAAQKVADKEGVSSRTVKRAGKFAKAVNAALPEEKAKILAGKAKVPKPPKKKPKSGNEKFREPEFMTAWGALYRWIDKLAIGYGVLTARGYTKETDEIKALFAGLKEWKKMFLDYQKKLAKAPQAEGEK